ncbi:MAG: flavin prenyltransferase UbiX [Planctomycetota bacterium]
MPASRRLVIALTGASGAPYGVRLLQRLAELGRPLDLVVSPSAAIVLREEVGPARWVEEGRARAEDFGLEGADLRIFDHRDVAAPIASGSALRGGMVILPCSMGTVGRIASGVSSNLIERAADVCLKERRPLVLCPRETPLSLIHLRNLTALAEAGATILPCAPGFYRRPESIDALLDHVVGKVLDVLDIEHDVVKPWGD